jgi:hypothetical protein
MLVKSLAVSVAAALLGPTLGIAAFLLVNADASNRQPFSVVSAAELGPWQTVVKCPDGKTLSAEARCRSSGIGQPS